MRRLKIATITRSLDSYFTRSPDGPITRYPSFHLQASNQLLHISHSIFDAPAVKLIDDVLRGAGIEIAGRADLDRGRPSEEKFDDITAGRDATHADDWDIHRLRGFVDHAQCYGLNRRSRQASGNIRDAGLARHRIHGEGNKGVDQR